MVVSRTYEVHMMAELGLRMVSELYKNVRHVFNYND